MKPKLLTILLLFFCFCFSLEAETVQYQNKRIEKIEIIPENVPLGSSFDANAVLSQLKTKSGDRFSQSLFDQDLKSLAKEYDRIDPQFEMRNNELLITIKVWPRPTIAKVLFKGDFKTKRKKLVHELNIYTRTIFNQQEFNKSFQKLKQYYTKKGYFEAQLEYKIIPIKDKNEVIIEIIINEGRSGRINKIQFKGFTKSEEKQILDNIYTKKFSTFTSWYTGTGIFNQDAIEHDKTLILQTLQNEGYANAKIEIKIIEDRKKNRINILLEASRGEKYYFGDITFSGNEVLSNEEIQSLIKAKNGEPYSPEKLQNTVTDITNTYGKIGYIDLTVTFTPKLTSDKPKYSIHFTIHEGECYHVGLIKVLGNRNTQSKVILHESLLVPGDVFNTRKLQATETRLQNMGYFKSSNVYATPSSESSAIETPLRDVNIEVDEENTGNFGIFFGFSTLDSIFGGAEISEKNFNIAGIPRIFSDGIRTLRGGGEYLRIKGSIGKKLNDYVLSWTKPYFLDTQWTIGFNINQNTSRLQASDYNIKSFTATANAFYAINPFLTFESHYRLRDVQAHVNSGVSEQLKEEARNKGIVSAVGVALLYNSTHNPYRATNGFVSELALEYAGVGGRFNFFKLQYDNTYYQPLYFGFVSKTRADVKFVLPVGGTTPHGIPLGERFFLGGETTVRGYRGFSIGPKYDNRDPKGGVSSLLLSEEIMFPLFPKVDLFGFIDAGSLSLERFHVDVLRASAGFGIRILIFNRMPFTYGMGFPFNPESHSDVQRNFFQLGGTF